MVLFHMALDNGEVVSLSPNHISEVTERDGKGVLVMASGREYVTQASSREELVRGLQAMVAQLQQQRQGDKRPSLVIPAVVPRG